MIALIVVNHWIILSIHKHLLVHQKKRPAFIYNKIF